MDGDINGIMTLYEMDAGLVPQPGHIVQGHKAIRSALQQFLTLRGRWS